jgi:hypothetical protein
MGGPDDISVNLTRSLRRRTRYPCLKPMGKKLNKFIYHFSRSLMRMLLLPKILHFKSVLRIYSELKCPNLFISEILIIEPYSLTLSLAVYF